MTGFSSMPSALGRLVSDMTCFSLGSCFSFSFTVPEVNHVMSLTNPPNAKGNELKHIISLTNLPELKHVMSLTNPPHFRALFSFFFLLLFI